jgi:2-polyprenyl-6-methoxyphenol hydroxylase-like FAD-dependent oxidoreductase
MHATIVGGGIAGLALAAALGTSARGLGRTVLERRAATDPAGLGFLLLENGIEALSRIIPGFDGRRTGHAVEGVALLDREGRLLARHALPAARCVERREMIGLLHGASIGADIRDSAAATGLVRDARGRVQAVTLEDGARVEGDLFFACDGANSRLRSILQPESRLSEASVLEIVSSVESAPLAAHLGTTFRKYHDPEGGLAAGLLATGPSRIVWFLQVDGRRWRPADRTGASLRAFATDRLAGWAPEVAAAIDATDFTRSHLWTTRDLAPLPRLAERNIALLGDAAHACLPFTSQGANGALVDAALLGELLREARTPEAAEAALARYCALRRPHHAHLHREGRRLHDRFLAPSPGRAPMVPIAA